ncbi:FUSC family protein [Gordonia sp. OPL2]|nr:FUSC family protein [Gordonia sp. OPL2]
MWISMGTLLLAAGERSVTYAARFRQIAVTTPLAAAAYFLGELSHAPHVVTIAVMAAVAFACGIVSGYSSTLSVGTMQAMLIAAIAIGVPAAAPYWEAAALFVAGALLYVFALAIEMVTDRRRPHRESQVAMLRSLAALSRARADDTADVTSLRARAISAIDAFDAMAIAARGSAHGPTPEYARAASVTRAADQLLARLLADDADRDLCARTADRLTDDADAVTHRRRLLPMEVSGNLLIRLRMLESAMWENDTGIEILPTAERARLSRPGPALIASAARLALCTGLAYTAFFTLTLAHGYWIALTVALVMKPDLGSIFSRAVLRSAGTVAGAVIGVTVSAVLVEPQIAAIAIAVLAACLPWAMARSYLWQALFLTPLVMILIDLVVPHESVLDLGGARVATTFVGGLIVVVFGYLIWPSQRHIRIAEPFDATLSDVAHYARDIVDEVGPRRIGIDRQSVYRQLSDTRVSLQRTLSEPPPAGAEAWAWVPVVAAAERITDRITGASAARTPVVTEDLLAVADALDRLATGSGSADDRTPVPPARAGNSADADIRQLADEIAHLRTLVARAQAN